MAGESFKEIQRRRYPPDGDVERWVREGPQGHVEYGGGPVAWGDDPPPVSDADRDVV